MAIKIQTMVWDHAPGMGITATDLLVLLRLADSANEETGIGWESVPTIARKVGSTDRTVQRCLRRLEKWGVIEEVPEDEWPKESIRYRSFPRRIMPVERWSVTPETDDEDRGDNLSPVTPVSPNPTTNYLTTSTSRSSGTSYLNSSKGEPALRTSVLGGSKAKRAARAAAAAEREGDPFKALLDEPQPEPVQPDLVEGRRRTAEKRQKAAERPLGPAAGAVRYFGSLAALRAAQGVPGATNEGALGKQIAGWLREGYSEATVREMIRLYWSDVYEPRRSSDRPAWQDFLAQRGRLHAEGQRVAEEGAREEKRFDESYWGM